MSPTSRQSDTQPAPKFAVRRSCFGSGLSAVQAKKIQSGISKGCPVCVGISIGPRTILAGQPHGSTTFSANTVYAALKFDRPERSSNLGTISEELPESTSSSTDESSAAPG